MSTKCASTKNFDLLILIVSQHQYEKCNFISEVLYHERFQKVRYYLIAAWNFKQVQKFGK